VFGAGPIDLVLAQSWCPIDLLWELPQLASFLDMLAGLARVIVLDNLGSGASDAVTDRVAAPIETFADVTLAVMDAVRSPRAVVFDASAGVSTFLFAAMYPQRLHSLILVNLRTSFADLRALTGEQRQTFARILHGTRSLEVANPRVAHDPALRQWWGRAKRLRSTREDEAKQVEWAAGVDVAAFLPTLRVPTLVLHRRDNPMFIIETSRAAASQIPNARFVELPGSESDIFLGDTRPAFDAIKEFLAEPEIDLASDRPLATVLFTDIVSSTAQLAAQGDDAWRHVLDEHDKHADRIISQHRGRLVRSTGDGILATFDGPTRAVRCAAALLASAAEQGITLRAGIHTGEIELRPPDIAGIAVHTASRIADLAGPNEILVSKTLVDLTAGSDLNFEPHGEHQLKGVPGTWPIFAAHLTN
jgi:class 3 adenylate cyclase